MAMPIYYLHLRNGDQVIPDLEGVDLPDLATAKDEALHSARELMSFEVIRGELNLDQSIEIQESGGECVCRIGFADALSLRVGTQLIDKRQLGSVSGHT